jgi:hypothetical protein
LALQDGNGICLPIATYLLVNYLYFRVFGSANLFKLASAGQFAETDQNSQREQDASRCCVRRSGGTDCDLFSVRRPTQTD